MAQFKTGDLREEALARVLVNWETGDALGSAVHPMSVVMDGDINVSSMPANLVVTGSIDANGEIVQIILPDGCASVGLQIVGMPGASQLNFEGTVDGVNWQPIEASNGVSAVNATAGDDLFILPGAGYYAIRVRAVAWGVGVANITFIASIGTAASILTGSIPAGVNSIGTVGLDAGEEHVGQVGGEGITITVTPTLTVAGAYVANDFVGTSATALIFANAARVSGGSGVIESAVLVDGDLQSVACELWLFDTAVTPPADNAAWTISDADAATCIGVIPFSTYYASALNSVAPANGLNIAFSAVATTIWGCLVTRGAPTYTSGKLSVRLSILQD